MLLPSLTAKREQKASAATKTQPMLKKGRGCLKGLKNKPMFAVKVTVYIQGEA